MDIISVTDLKHIKGEMNIIKKLFFQPTTNYASYFVYDFDACIISPNTSDKIYTFPRFMIYQEKLQFEFGTDEFYKMINEFSEEHFYAFAVELVNIINVFHKQYLYITDMKGANIMIDKYGKIKLIDLGGIKPPK